MAECYRCGISDEKERLYDAISNKGVVKVCRNCSDEGDLPLVQPVDLNRPERIKSVYERLSIMAKLDPEKHRKMILEKERQESLRKRKYDTTLKDVIDSNLEKKRSQPRTDLIENFHWILMRTRRSQKLTQKQLAENIGEPESIIKSAEEGVILNNADTLVRKLEGYFGIKIRKVESPYSSEQPKYVKAGIAEDPVAKEARERFEKEGKFDKNTSEALTIADLQEIKKKKESENSGGFFSFLKKNRKQEETDSKEEKELSDEETDEILFGK